ncbi:hypothetical protein [Halomonas sp. C05BenzN]|uniref:hypothetical protein n=1 Tax=Halomonas sp. C05BenzN TaxID=3411041 RepID=UPI003B92C155
MMVAMERRRPLGRAMVGAALMAMSWGVKAEASPVTVAPLTVEPEGDHYHYRMHMTIQGDDLFWDLTQGPDVTLVAPDEEHLSQVSGFDPLYTGEALGHRPHQVASRFGALVSRMPAEAARPPLEYQDVFDNRQRTDAVRVVVEPTGATRELAGREASAYTLAVVSDKSRWRDEAWHPYHALNLGTVWVFDDLPFSPAPLQLSRYVFNLVFAPHSVSGLEEFYQEQLISALAPLGMLAGARMQEVQVSAEALAELEAEGWRLEGDEAPGQSRGYRFELLTTELITEAEPLDYAALEGMSRLDAASLDYLETPLTMVNRLGLCPALPVEMDTEELLATMEEHASFRGRMQGSIDGEVLGEASFGSQDDSFGRGFMLTLESYDPGLRQAACLTLLRVDAAMPDAPQTLDVAAGQDQADAGELVAYLALTDLTEPGQSRSVAVGLGNDGQVTLERVDEETLVGHLRLNGQVTPLEQLTDSQPFVIEGEFSARQAWDRVPMAR